MSTLKYTLDQVRSRQSALIGVKGLPNVWWPLPAGNDCVAFQLHCLGMRSRGDLAPHYISISAFRAWAHWPEYPVSEAVPGDLLLENWTGEKDDNGHLAAEHMEAVYSIDHHAAKTVIVAANTGPKPGVPTPRGVWKKERPIDSHLIRVIRPPFRVVTPSKSRLSEVRAVAHYLNEQHLGETSYAANDGEEGPIYWWLVQTWGRKNDVYGSAYVIDGVPGPRTRQVEAIIYKLAK